MKPIIVDVRAPNEYEDDHVTGAINIPYNLIEEQSLTDLNIHKNDSLWVYCRSGNRAETAKGILQKLGYENVKNTINQKETEEMIRQT